MNINKKSLMHSTFYYLIFSIALLVINVRHAMKNNKVCREDLFGTKVQPTLFLLIMLRTAFNNSQVTQQLTH
ncbi:MAG: hypothetical protein OXC48_08210 [Endozoicomonadaceae bacterium]|nr:hypothetical protein [Endozoicomonadaceae bacterium]